MPFVKVGPAIYINTDNVIDITFLPAPNTDALITTTQNSTRQIRAEAAHYLLACVEAQTALSETPPEQPSLKTRIAQALRYEYPNGATARDLTYLVPEESNHQELIGDALTELHTENVVIKIGNLFYHASNKPNSDKAPVF